MTEPAPRPGSETPAVETPVAETPAAETAATGPKKDAAYYRKRQREVQRKQLYRKYGVGPAQPLNTWTMAVRLLALMLTMAAFGIGYYFYTAFGL
jgi:hypothetical protein